MGEHDLNEADYIEDGANYLEEYKCKPCDDCRKMECSIFALNTMNGFGIGSD